MTTFAEHLEQLCVDVRHVLTSAAVLDPADLPVAVAAHHALVSVLRQLQPPVSGPGDAVAGSLWSGVEDLETKPVAVLAQLLARHPSGPQLTSAVAELSPTDVHVHVPVNAQGARWQQVHRGAVVVSGMWDASVSDRRSVSTRPHGDGQWTLTAHVAALAQAVAVLDVDLGRALALAGELHQGRVLQYASTSGLRTAAAAVFELATSGPLPAVQVYPRPERPLYVAGAVDVQPAQLRLAMLLRRTGADLHPQDLELVARTQFRAATAAAAILAGLDPDTAALLGQYAQALTFVPPAASRVQSLTGRDPVTVAQARQIATYLAGLQDLPRSVATPNGPAPRALSPHDPARGGVGADAADSAAVRGAQGFAHATPAVARAMSTTANDRLRTGAWIVDISRNPTGTQPRSGRRAAGRHWARHTPGALLPLLDRLTHVAATVGALASQKPTERSSPAARRFDGARSRPTMQDGPLLDVAASAVEGLREATLSRSAQRRPTAPPRRPERANQDVLPTPAGGPLLSRTQVELLEQVASWRPMNAIYAARASSADTLARELTFIYAQLGPESHVGVGQEAARHAGRALEVLAALAETGTARRTLLATEATTSPSSSRDPNQNTRLREATARLTWAQRRLDTARAEFQSLSPDHPDPEHRQHRRARLTTGRSHATEQQEAHRLPTGTPSRPSAPSR